MNLITRFCKPPHSTEGEQAVIGIVLLDGSRVGTVVHAGGSNLFLDPVHAEIFRIIQQKDRDGNLVDVTTVAAAMAGHPGLDSLGGLAYLARLAVNARSPSSLMGLLDLLADQSKKRQIFEMTQVIQAALADGEESADQIIARLEAALAAFGTVKRAGPISMMKAVVTAIEQIEAARLGQVTDVVRSGIAALDRIIPGFYPGELILIGGRPSMGKTAVALSFALNMARAGQGVCIVSLEMNPEALAMRAVSEQTAVQDAALPYAHMRQGSMDREQHTNMLTAAKIVADLPITFLPQNFSDIGALIYGVKRVQRDMNGNLRLLIVDYAQLLKAEGHSRYEQITAISLALKALAGQLNIPVIALSQLSRAVEQREDKRPTLADLRESGQLEQDADTVMFCYRDEYYLKRMQPAEQDLEATATWLRAMDTARGRLDIIVAKQRQGEIGTATMRFDPAVNRIWEDTL
ncbi:replicative DNA helicase [Gemmobacter sp.]|uniref:replicative DNA helicase n=1 Tax=Gemmobacter sp. TaxID=1898957 RepID=UPI002AFEB74E|nr:DnaB-like helicase C-terminal domain-containing protein [Gemmobacter sp.]